MKNLVPEKTFFILFFVQIYCGFVQDSYISISLGSIISFSDNRHDPRFIVTNSNTGASYVLAINYNSVWTIKNITGSGYTYVG